MTRTTLVLLVAFSLATLSGVWSSGSVGLTAAAWIALLLWLPALPILALRWLNPPFSAFMLLTRYRLGGRPLVHEWCDLEHVSPLMWLATIAGEDAWFRDHHGFDWHSMREAHAHNRTSKKRRGGSTITQQLAKNLFLWPARSYVRKALEAWLTLVIEALWSKRRILEVYLNTVQLSTDLFGVQAASRRFFARDASALSLQQAALLAAALPNPIIYTVDDPPARTRLRQTWIMAAMRRLGDSYLERL